MKKIITLAFVCLTLCVAAQTNNNDADKQLRAARMSYYIDEAKVEYTNATAEATAHVVLAAFREGNIIPNVDISNLPVEEADKLKKLLARLKVIGDTPPTWQQLVQLEEKRLIDYYRSISRTPKYK